MQEEIISAIHAYAKDKGVEAGSYITSRGGWSSHEDTGFGMHGGDYDEYEVWVWKQWAKETLEKVYEPSQVPATADLIITQIHTRAVAADFLLIKKEWLIMLIHEWPAKKIETSEGKARLEKIRIASEKAKALKRMREQGVRKKERHQASLQAEEEKRVTDLVLVRKEWKFLNNTSFKCRSARNNGFVGLHTDAQKLLLRIWEASDKAESLRRRREVSAPRVEIVEVEKPKVTSSTSGFGTSLADLF